MKKYLIWILAMFLLYSCAKKPIYGPKQSKRLKNLINRGENK